MKRLSRVKNRTFAERHVGQVVAVLFEQGSGNGEPVSGWTDNYLRVTLQQPSSAHGVPSGLREVRIDEATDDGLRGRLVR